MKTRLMIPTLVTLAAVVLLAGCGGNQPHELERGGLTAGDLMTSLIDRTTTTLSGVTSRATAEAAQPVLEEINEGFKDLIKTKGELSEQGQVDLADQAAKAMPGIKDNWRRVRQQSYGDILGPVMDDLVGTLTKLL